MDYRDEKIGRRGLLAAAGSLAVWDTSAAQGATTPSAPQDLPALTQYIRELRSPTGGQMVGAKRPEPSTYPWIMRDWIGVRVEALDWIPTDIRRDIAAQSNSEDLAPYVQAALDEAPLGCDLHFGPGDWRIFSTVTARRQMNLIGGGMRLQGYFGADTTSNLLDIRIEEAALDSADTRGMTLRGIRGFFSKGGNSVCTVNNVKPMAGNLGMIFENCGFGAPDTGKGSALEFSGVDTQQHMILGGGYTNRIKLSGCADGVKIIGALILGLKTGIHVDVAEGAFETIIRDNLIVSRDGAIAIYNGSQVHILNNQLEQFPAYGPNQLAQKCQVLVYPQTYGSRNIVIKGNNFGGGSNCEVPLDLRTRHTHPIDDTLVDENVFNPGSTGLDWRILDAGVRATRFGPNNRLRGSRGGVTVTDGVASANSENSLDLMSFSDLGSWTYGVWKTGTDLSLPATTTPGTGFRFKKTFDDQLLFEGLISTSSNSKGIVLGTLPVGFRPKVQAYSIVAGAGGPTTLRFDTNGEIIGASIPATGNIYMSGFMLPVKGRVKYDPGV